MHRAIQELKKITGKADTETEEKKKNNKNRTKYDEVEFKEKGGKYYMFHKGQEIAMYIGYKPFQDAKRGFESPRFLKWKMEKLYMKIYREESSNSRTTCHINVENAGKSLMVILFCPTLICNTMDSVPLAHT